MEVARTQALSTDTPKYNKGAWEERMIVSSPLSGIPTSEEAAALRASQTELSVCSSDRGTA